MCEFASLVVAKKSVHWCMEDSHEKIIEEHNLTADGVRGPNIVRVEIVPPDRDPSRPLDEWIYRIDQDLLPNWHDAEDTERRARGALIDLVAARVFLTGEHEVGPGYFVAAGDARLASGSASVRASGSASVEASGSASVEAYGSASVRASGSASVEASSSASVRAHGSASVEAYGSASVEAYDSASVEAYGSASVEAYGSASVRAYGSASVRACKDHATCRHYNPQDCKPDGPFAVMIDCTGARAACSIAAEAEGA